MCHGPGVGKHRFNLYIQHKGYAWNKCCVQRLYNQHSNAALQETFCEGCWLPWLPKPACQRCWGSHVKCNGPVSHVVRASTHVSRYRRSDVWTHFCPTSDSGFTPSDSSSLCHSGYLRHPQHTWAASVCPSETQRPTGPPCICVKGIIQHTHTHTPNIIDRSSCGNNELKVDKKWIWSLLFTHLFLQFISIRPRPTRKLEQWERPRRWHHHVVYLLI